ncbi:hypothetical protein PIG55_08540 [Bifidobacterium catenulatum]|jgi:hypothetical protein|nr:hypothetical protein [Bifidobacterium catenulatum]MDF4086954.1 hypothetical protein [Bifidobacterium catenulatum]MDF4094267.1 hypothetical protein [Bifidobacterium catenulatum]
MRERREREDVERKRQMNEDRRHRELLAQNERIARASERPTKSGQSRDYYRPEKRRGGRTRFLLLLIIIGVGIWWAANHPREISAVQSKLRVTELPRIDDTTSVPDQSETPHKIDTSKVEDNSVKKHKKTYPKCSATVTDQCQQ